MAGVRVEELLSERGIAADADGRTLLVNGRRVDLDNRCLAILRALAERFGERVGKDHLLAAAWPNQVVHENSLAKAVSRLRQALEGSRLQIVASYGVGYSLRDVPEAEEAEPVASLPERPPVEMSVRPTPPPRRPIVLGIVLLLAAAAAGIVFVQRQSAPSVAIRSSAPITHDAPDRLATILWVDDHPSNNALEIEYLKQNRVAVHEVKSTDDAMKLLRINDYKLVVSDLGRGDDRLAGLKMTQAMAAARMRTPVIIYTVRPNDLERQVAQRRLVSDHGAADLALSPAEVRSKVMDRVTASPDGPS